MKARQNIKTPNLLPLTIISFRKKYSKENVLSIVFIFISYCLYASPANYPASYTPEDMLEDLLSGEYNENRKAVKWYATPGDMNEFNGQPGEHRDLYSFVDTTLIVQQGDEKVYYTIFRTAPMITNEEGGFVNANSCHVCGVNVGYFSYTKENGSIYVTKFKRNFAVHGSFGINSYTLSMISLGDGYELLKVDDIYEGMGTTSVATKFYQDGELMLSMISKENNNSNRYKHQKGYYEFKTDFTYDNNEHTIIIKQTGYRMDEKWGKKILINKTKKLIFDSYTLQF